jgi:3-methyladenine DNA glycosylase AlkC
MTKTIQLWEIAVRARLRSETIRNAIKETPDKFLNFITHEKETVDIDFIIKRYKRNFGKPLTKKTLLKSYEQEKEIIANRSSVTLNPELQAKFNTLGKALGKAFSHDKKNQLR